MKETIEPEIPEQPKYKMGKKFSMWKFCLSCDRLIKATEECTHCYPEYDFKENPE